MPFPVATRVKYARNPIEFVICQLRFPPILRIDAEIPSRFQDLIRVRYPLYESKRETGIPLTLPPEVARFFSQSLSFATGQRSHEFIDATRSWTISLDREKLTLDCRKYESWEEFKDFLGTPLDALRQEYSPPFYLRIGLRYRDVIRRSEHGLSDAGWKDLLPPWIAGLYCSPDVESDIERTAHQGLLRLSDGQGKVLINHGPIFDERSKEWCYALDADFFHDGQTEDPDVIARLDFLNQEARRFFQWSITDRLHRAMGPQSVPGS